MQLEHHEAEEWRALQSCLAFQSCFVVEEALACHPHLGPQCKSFSLMKGTRFSNKSTNELHAAALFEEEDPSEVRGIVLGGSLPGFSLTRDWTDAGFHACVYRAWDLARV